MKIKTISIFSAFLALTIAACDSDPEDYYVEKVVVQGVMYTGLPMSVDLARNNRWDDAYDPIAVRLSDAVVRIRVNDGSEFSLTEANSGVPGTYKAASDAPLIEKGSKYDLFVEYQGDTITASTIAAAEFAFDSLVNASRDSSFRDTVEFGNWLTLPNVFWTPDTADFGYTFLYENLEPDWDQEYRQSSRDLGKSESPLSAWVVQETDEFLTPPTVLLITGHYRMRGYSADAALWNYFGTITPNSADNEPVSNVEGGLGVFSAVGADTAYFYLVSELGPE